MTDEELEQLEARQEGVAERLLDWIELETHEEDADPAVISFCLLDQAAALVVCETSLSREDFIKHAAECYDDSVENLKKLTTLSGGTN